MFDRAKRRFDTDNKPHSRYLSLFLSSSFFFALFLFEGFREKATDGLGVIHRRVIIGEQFSVRECEMTRGSTADSSRSSSMKIFEARHVRLSLRDTRYKSIFAGLIHEQELSLLRYPL